MLEMTEKEKYQETIFFPVGDPNPYGKYFVGQSYLAPVSTEQVPIFNVTFEYYQEWGKEPVEMTPGTVVNIPANVKHWHGASPNSWFSHLAIEVTGEETSAEWLEAVDADDYSKLK